MVCGELDRLMACEAQQPQLTVSQIHLYMHGSGSAFINKHHAKTLRLNETTADI